MLCALLLVLVGPWLAGRPPLLQGGTALPASSPSPGAAALEAPARVELLEGRASLARAGGVVELERSARELEVLGEAYLELRPRSRVALRWNATASLVVHGPAVLEWGPREGLRAGLEWRFVELEQAQLEVRRGPLRLALPGGWSGTLESGAGWLRGLPGGGVEWRHDAGLPILLAAPHGPGEVRPPWVVLAGAWLRLRPEESLPQMLSGSEGRLLDPYARRGFGPPERDAEPPWGGFAWPWPSGGPRGAAPPPAPAAPAGSAAPRARPLPEGISLAPTAGPGIPAPAPAEPAGRRAPPAELALPLECPAPPGPAAPAPPPAELAADGPEPVGSRGVDRGEVPGEERSEPPRAFAEGGQLRLTPWGVRRFRAP